MRILRAFAVLSALSLASPGGQTLAWGNTEIDDIRANPSFGGVAGNFFELDFGASAIGPVRFDVLCFIGVRLEKEIINLTPHPTERGPSLVSDDFRDGIEVTQSRTVDLGFGPNGIATGSPALSLINPSLGLLPVFGSKAVSRQYVRTLDESKKIDHLRLPAHGSDLEAWAPGFEVQFKASGGMVLSAGTGYQGAAGVGARYLVMADWQVGIKKLGPKQAYVQAIRTRLHSLAFSPGAAFAFVELSGIQSVGDEFSFIFDFNDSRAVEAYEGLIRGRMTATQLLVEDPQSGVKALSRRHNHLGGKFTNWFLGIPELVFGFRTKGFVHASMDVIGREGREPVRLELAARLDEKAKGGIFLRNHSKTTKADFYATHFTRGPLSGYAAQYLWSFEQERASTKNLRQALSSLMAQTGLRKALEVEVPHSKSGYLRARFKMLISQAATDRLMRVSLEDADAFRAFSLALLTNYFENGDDPDDLCPKQPVLANPPVSDEIPPPPFETRKDIPLCIERLRSKTLAATDKMVKLLQEMSLQSGSARNFVRAYAKFGSALLANQFTFGAVLKVIENEPAKIDYIIEGERISRFKRLIKVTGK
ncbi:MAG: hypothetical protein A2428_02565 [Bdellovibrionales bacterium RIFOXYC1_FULL_54_43]|nr:MAG: hypothetical protein A2428_02565 [Bdellovibrionales bacterium RIFOXYC1_FULL_54_43]OFZ80186.1 MAG: hypothetical protein A2603_11380 [Bdellovibrionales bacterium RIFOXYD1_FULL_55_31]